jgi:hypothetical protein
MGLVPLHRPEHGSEERGMSVLVKCDRCGNQEKTSGVMLFAGLTGPAIPTARPELPDGWTRPTLPHEDGSAWQHELCPACKADLIRFMAGAPVVEDSELASQVMGLAKPGGRPAPDLGTGTRPDQICPDCGHLRHSGSCPDQVPEKGSCDCGLLTTLRRMKELGIDD